MEKSVFLRMVKADLVKRQVWGKAAVEQPDSAIPPEIMDYERSKPNFVQWSETVRMKSGGRSLGNVRAMHGGYMMAVGKVIEMSFDDAAKSVNIGVEVVDENAWVKVQKGVYTGFSIGGRYGERWPDKVVKGATRYEAVPIEISLVDVPCIPDATFEVIKADGGKELRKFMFIEEKDEEEQDSDGADQSFIADRRGDGTNDGSDEIPFGEEKTFEETQDEEQLSSESTEDTRKEVVPEGQAGSVDERIKAMVVGVLLELGLVQLSSGGNAESDLILAMSQKKNGLTKAVQATFPSEIERKVNGIKERLSKNLNEVQSVRKDFSLMKYDLGKILSAIEGLEKRGGVGPVVRDLGVFSTQAMADLQKVSVLKEMLPKADPTTRQVLESEISRLEIKTIQTQKITLNGQ